MINIINFVGFVLQMLVMIGPIEDLIDFRWCV